MVFAAKDPGEKDGTSSPVVQQKPQGDPHYRSLGPVPSSRTAVGPAASEARELRMALGWYLSWVVPKTDPETKACMQVVYLEGGPKKHH